MGKPLDPKSAKKIADNIKKLSKQSGDVGQAAVGEFLRDPAKSRLPYEGDGTPTGIRTASIPLDDGGVAGISYDPTTPPQTDFDFTVKGPDGQPRNVDGIEGMENGHAKIPPMSVMPAIEKAQGAAQSTDRTTAFATRSNIAPEARAAKERKR